MKLSSGTQSPSPSLSALPAAPEQTQKDPAHRKAPVPKTREHRKHNPLAKPKTKPKEPRKWNQLTLADKITIIKFEEEAKQNGTERLEHRGAHQTAAVALQICDGQVQLGTTRRIMKVMTAGHGS